MTTPLYPLSPTPAPALTDEITLQTTLDCLIEHLPIETQGYWSIETIFEMLVHAASRGQSLEQTTRGLQGGPSSNDLRYHLNKYDDMEELQSQLNTALQSRIPSGIRKGKQRLAIDLNLIPYYGKVTPTAAPYLYRSRAQLGTCTFFAYATAYVIRKDKRVTLAIHAVQQQQTLVAIVSYLLATITPLYLRIKRLYLDRGFFCVPVIRWLQALDIPFLMPAIIRGKQAGTRALLHGRNSYQTSYTLRSQLYGNVDCTIQVVCSYRNGRRGQHGIQYFAYVTHRVWMHFHTLHQDYRARFGIETSYRLKNQCRIRTTTHNPILRLLFVALAFILVNLWVYLLWHFVCLIRPAPRLIFRRLFPLKQMTEFLAHAIEREFPPLQTIFLPAN